MPTLAGWLTGEQVPNEIIEQTLTTMGAVLGQHGGDAGRVVQPGFGLITFSEPAYATQEKIDAPVLDWVPDRRTLVYRRPLSGTHVLYYIADWPAEGNLLFATEMKALFAVGVPRRLHLAALDALLRYGFIPAPWTAFQDIYVVPAGSILRWQKAKTVMNSATDYSFDQPSDVFFHSNKEVGTRAPARGPTPHHTTPAPTDTDSPPIIGFGWKNSLNIEGLDTLYTLLDKTTAALLPPHEQLVVLTDGSIASALVTSLAAGHTRTPFTVATIDYKKGGIEEGWVEAERLASAHQRPFLAITGVDAPEFWTATIAALEAPTVDSMSLALHQLLHTTSIETNARVALSGLGAHVLLGTPLGPFLETKQGQQDILTWYQRNLSMRPGMSRAGFWSKDAAQLIFQEEPWEQTLHARKLARRAAQFSEDWQRWYYLDLHLRLPDLIVGAAEQLATAERMALRSPYLVPDVMDMLTGLPVVLQDGTRKEGLLEALGKRVLQGYGREIESLKAPTASLVRVGDSELLQQTLSREALRETGIFDPEIVQELLRHDAIEEGMAPRELLLVFTTQLLCRMFGVHL